MRFEDVKEAEAAVAEAKKQLEKARVAYLVERGFDTEIDYDKGYERNVKEQALAKIKKIKEENGLDQEESESDNIRVRILSGEFDHGFDQDTLVIKYEVTRPDGQKIERYAYMELDSSQVLWQTKNSIDLDLSPKETR